MTKLERWKGRNSTKDLLRHEIWAALEASGAAVGSPWSTIPNFVGAQDAAQQVLAMPQWQAARVVKSNPDAAQAWLRLFALQQGKRVYMPVPELVANYPFVLLDPNELTVKGIAFEDVMYSNGALLHGKRVEFADIEPLDFCIVGCVAVTTAGGRTGKGAGFADLEMGLFRYYNLMRADTPVVTTVHAIQLVADDRVVMENHDTPLNWIATPSQLISTDTTYPSPGALDWAALQPDQYENIPFLTGLKAQLDLA